MLNSVVLRQRLRQFAADLIESQICTAQIALPDWISLFNRPLTASFA
jgi:hypothetical protein